MSIHRGEIYFVSLDPVKGREQAGKRPVLVLSIDARLLSWQLNKIML
jgi:mRNA interferase MazF